MGATKSLALDIQSALEYAEGYFFFDAWLDSLITNTRNHGEIIQPQQPDSQAQRPSEGLEGAGQETITTERSVQAPGGETGRPETSGESDGTAPSQYTDS